MFRVYYNPKNFVKVRAVQVTAENASDVTSLLLGRVVWNTQRWAERKNELLGIDVPTFEGIKHFEIDSWILRGEDNTLTKMSAEEFDKTYEVARNMGGKD